MNLANLKISARLGIGFLLVFALVGASALTGVWRLGAIGAIVDLGTGKTTAIAVGNAPREVVVQPSAGGAKISIANFAFAPPQITIALGESVTWSNYDGAPHTMTFKNGSTGAVSLSRGMSFHRAFDQPGSYEYFCSFHPYMTGRIVVRIK